MKRRAGGGARLLGRLRRSDIRKLGDAAGLLQAAPYELALVVDVGIDLVRDAVITGIPIESDIVRSGAHPKILAIHLEWRLPQAQMMALRHHLDGRGVRQPVILHPAE